MQSGVSADASGKAKGFLLMMKDGRLVQFMLFMTDVISLLAKLSLTFQDQSATVCDIKEKLDTVTVVLKKYKTRYLLFSED